MGTRVSVPSLDDNHSERTLTFRRPERDLIFSRDGRVLKKNGRFLLSQQRGSNEESPSGERRGANALRRRDSRSRRSFYEENQAPLTFETFEGFSATEMVLATGARSRLESGLVSPVYLLYRPMVCEKKFFAHGVASSAQRPVE